MPTIDYHAYEIATKVLCISFLILITFINLTLIEKILKKPKFFTFPKFMILISLAAADIVHALFYLLYATLMIFNKVESNPCGLQFAIKVYHELAISFIYGIGITLLAIELVIRHKGLNSMSSTTQTLVGFTFSSIPWLLAAAVILPLTMVGFDFQYCIAINFTKSRVLTMYSVCDIASPGLAFLTCLVFSIVKLNRRQESYHAQNNPQQNFNAGPVTEKGSQSGGYNYVHLPAYRTHEQPDVFSSTQPLFSNSSPPTNTLKEKRVLFAVAVVLLLCVVPVGVATVSQPTLSVFDRIVAGSTLEWLLNFRSILAPAILLFAL
jgi:hypothetical protein